LADVLFHYQKLGAEFLASKRLALLADEMGLGKSAQAITACDLVGAKRILVLCPAVARINWLREFQNFSSQERTFVVLESSQDLSLQTPDTSVIASYDLIAKDPTKISGNFDVLILDESHFLKAVDSQRSKAVWGKEGLVRRGRRVWALSGTPAANHAGELWTLLYSFGQTKLTYNDFVERYCSYYVFQRRNQITGTNLNKVNELRAMLAPIILRRRKEDVMQELPPIQYGHVVVPRSPVDFEVQSSFMHWYIPRNRELELFEELRRQEKAVRSVVENSFYTQATLDALEAMAKSISTLRMYIGLQKIKAVTELVTEEFKQRKYEKLVIFALHRDVIEGLRLSLHDFGAVTLYGGTPPDERQKRIDRFQRNPKCKVFIGNIKAAGTAITLTAAHHMIFIEQSWSPGDNAQAAMRCHRIGQKNPVFVRFIGLADSLDERLMYLLKKKSRELLDIFDSDRRQILKESDKKLGEELKSQVENDSDLKQFVDDLLGQQARTT
jgi:SWI/SNF-related matrix-associated actin-dependent regulator 1 of chromatin subfamily A